MFLSSVRECCFQGLQLIVPATFQVQAHTFELCEDTSMYGQYQRGGIVTVHKETKTLDFKSLAQALDDPGEFLLCDFAKMERPGILHMGFQALNLFQVVGVCNCLPDQRSQCLGFPLSGFRGQ